jgi:hypothetical protein
VAKIDPHAEIPLVMGKSKPAAERKPPPHIGGHRIVTEQGKVGRSASRCDAGGDGIQEAAYAASGQGGPDWGFSPFPCSVPGLPSWAVLPVRP